MFIEQSQLDSEQTRRIQNVIALFHGTPYQRQSLSETLKAFFLAVGIEFGLKNHGVRQEQVGILAKKAFADICHQSNMVPVDVKILQTVIEKAI